MNKQDTPSDDKPASERITERIAEIGGWRGKAMAHMRALIHEAEPNVVEEWKWAVPVWESNGGICTGESYKDKIKLTFHKGAALPDPHKLFNSSLEGNVRRALDIFEGDKVNAAHFKALIRAAVELNASKVKAKKPAAKKAK